jgi:dihydroorotate dehydrogenase
MYQFWFRRLFVHLDPELTHELGAGLLKVLTTLRLLRPRKSVEDAVNLAGLQFDNRLGLAAGFDKNAELIRPMYALGFGHVEIGTVTALPQPGNPKPRLFRLPADRALINRMGFNNHGAQAVAARLAKLRLRGGPLPIIGVNIGKSRLVAVEDAVADYEQSSALLAPYADYLVVNVSSPNTPGLRDLQQVKALRPILEAVVAKSVGKPVFVKLAPDLSDEDALAIAQLAQQIGLTGLVVANTTTSRRGLKATQSADQAGGLSGAPLRERALELLVLLREPQPGLLIISVGGVETAADFEDRLELGADLVQSYTGFVYGGPTWPKKIQRLRK